MGEVAKADDTAHLIGWSVYDVIARSLAIVLGETRMTCGKLGKKMASMTEDDVEVSTESLRRSADTKEPI